MGHVPEQAVRADHPGHDGRAFGYPRTRAAGDAAVLRLQRSVGNRAVRALLRDPAGPRGELATQAGLVVDGGLDPAAWKTKVAAAKDAMAKGDAATAKALYGDLLRDLAQTAGADVVPDITDTFPVNVAHADSTGYKAGLNLVLGPGRATTAYIDSAGNWGVSLDVSTGASQPHIAIRMFSEGFEADKAMSLAYLRHEMTHARHLERALEALQSWHKRGGKGDKAKFEAWVKSKAGLSKVDIALVTETAEALSASPLTEALAYTEGFMSVFHLIDPPPPPTHPIFLELLGVLTTTKVYPWKSSPPAVQDELVGRLERYYCELLDGAHRKAFDDWVSARVKQERDDAAALKTGGSGGASAGARERQNEQFSQFIDRLAAIPGKCTPGKGGGAAGAVDDPAAVAARYSALLRLDRPGDKTLVIGELRRLDAASLAKLDDAAAALPKGGGAGLRRTIGFVRHSTAGAIATGSDDLTITGGATALAPVAVDGGTVVVTSDSDLTWTEKFANGPVSQGLPHGIVFQFQGKTAGHARWVQFIWRQIVVTDAHGQETVLDKANTNSSGISYRLTPKGSPPIIAVDRGTKSEPWYERGSPSHRDPRAITVADVPAPNDGMFKECLTGGNPASKVVSSAHLATYLVRDDRVLFRVATDVTYTWQRNKTDDAGAPYAVRGPVYEVKGKAASALEKRDRDALIRDFPDLDYLP